VLITDEELRDGYKMGNDRVRQRVREKPILPGKQHHLGKSNTLSPSLIICLEQALINVEPSLEVRKKKIAGITRQIPSTLSKSRGQGLAIRWIVESARGRRRKEGKRFSECLAEELVSAYHKKGEPRQKRDALHKLAESNRSFLRYRWW
jgi:small subunit ribosomal protein S7